MSETDRKNAVEKYDFFVIGSDQIWHPDVYRHFGEQFGEFCPADRIMCLSPSFGVAEIPDDVESAYQEGLCRIQRLSVREEAGAQIIKRLTGKSATVLCDPTMGIEPKRWLKMSSLSACPDQKYALAYFLGGLDENDEKRLVEKVEAVGLKYVDVLDVKNVEQYSASPNSFLGLISQADIVLTDSFHASVFSLLFTKPLAIIARREKGMGTFSRLETLADSFFVTDRLFTSTEALSEESLRQLMEERLPYSGERSQKALCELNNYIDSELIRMFG